MICPSNIFRLRLPWFGPRIFTPVVLAHIPVGLPGVYLLQHSSGRTGSYPVFYVGQSLDLRRRLGEQLGGSSSRGVRFFRTLRRTYFSAAHVPPALLDDVERSLIRLLLPPANDQAPWPSALLLASLPGAF
jgi:hypothetical protein